MNYHSEGVVEVGVGLDVDFLEELFVLFEGREPVEEVVQHLRNVAAQTRVEGHAALRQLPHVRHHPLVAEVVRERLHPLGQQLHHVRAETTQFLLFITSKSIFFKLSK